MTVMEKTGAPARSQEQRMAALKRANAIRTYRSELKVRLKRGQTPAREHVLSPASELETMKVFELLLAAPKVGRVKANKIISRAKISPSKTLGGLTERQRRELLAVLGRTHGVV